MNDTQNFPYETRLNLYYEPLQVVDEKALSDACEYKWYNQTLCHVNGSVVRLGVISAVVAHPGNRSSNNKHRARLKNRQSSHKSALGCRIECRSSLGESRERYLERQEDTLNTKRRHFNSERPNFNQQGLNEFSSAFCADHSRATRCATPSTLEASRARLFQRGVTVLQHQCHWK